MQTKIFINNNEEYKWLAMAFNPFSSEDIKNVITKLNIPNERLKALISYSGNNSKDTINVQYSNQSILYDIQENEDCYIVQRNGSWYELYREKDFFEQFVAISRDKDILIVRPLFKMSYIQLTESVSLKYISEIMNENKLYISKEFSKKIEDNDTLEKIETEITLDNFSYSLKSSLYNSEEDINLIFNIGDYLCKYDGQYDFFIMSKDPFERLEEFKNDK